MYTYKQHWACRNDRREEGGCKWSPLGEGGEEGQRDDSWMWWRIWKQLLWQWKTEGRRGERSTVRTPDGISQKTKKANSTESTGNTTMSRIQHEVLHMYNKMSLYPTVASMETCKQHHLSNLIIWLVLTINLQDNPHNKPLIWLTKTVFTM